MSSVVGMRGLSHAVVAPGRPCGFYNPSVSNIEENTNILRGIDFGNFSAWAARKE